MSDDSSAAERSTAERDEQRDRWFRELQETGSPEIRDRLVESYAPLAEYFAGRYAQRGAESEDLRQAAHLALVKAVDRYDPARSVRFSTFAGRTIDGELKRYFRDRTWAVRVPRGLKEQSADVRRASDDLAIELGRPPTISELAERVGIDADLVIEALDVQSAYRATSLDQTSSEHEGVPLHATMGKADTGFERTETRQAVDALLETLPDRERRIVELRFFEELSQSEIADRVGISQMHVSRLLRRSLESLRDELR